LAYNPAVITIRSRGKLPHWEDDCAIYFVTFRLADSLPQSVLKRFEFERQDIIRTANAVGRALTSIERQRLEKLFSEQIERNLDSGAGQCLFFNPAAADIVAEALRHLNGVRYQMYAWCVMPNHVHTLFRLLGDHMLEEVLHSWKSYPAKKVNALFRRSGKIWQHEYYDHLVRTEKEFYRAIAYILDNPKKARLQNWQWVGLGK
jgi:REP element-mobilizing transposase RayT